MSAGDSIGTTLTVLLSGFLCVAALATELGRERRSGLFDFQFTVTCVYVTLFGIAPILVVFLWESGAIPLAWSFVTSVPPTSGYYAFAVAVALASYFLMLLGISLGRSDRVIDRQLATPGTLVLGGGLFALCGLGSLLLYARDIGGVQFMLESVLAYRASVEPVYSNLGFLKTISPVAIAGAFLLFAAIQTGRRSVWIYCAFASALLVSMVALLVNGGRLMVIQFLLAFPLFFLLRGRNRLLMPMFVFGLLIFITFTLFGQGVFDLFRGSERISEQMEFVTENPGAASASLGLEFSYPVQNLAVSLRDVGTAPFEHRWFVDVPIGLAYLLPKRLLSLDLPQTVTMQLSDLALAPVPADLLTFGYWSAGPIGVVAIVIFFGWLIARFESWFPASGNPAMLTLRAAWVAYLCSRVMYGNPHHTFITALPLVAATLVVMFASRRTRLYGNRANVGH